MLHRMLMVQSFSQVDASCWMLLQTQPPQRHARQRGFSVALGFEQFGAFLLRVAATKLAVKNIACQSNCVGLVWHKGRASGLRRWLLLRRAPIRKTMLSPRPLGCLYRLD